MGCALWLSAAVGVGCAETSEILRADPRLTAQVQVSKLEPGPACQPLGALDASSGDCEEHIYETAYELLRNKAALRNGNYVVIDSISGPHPLLSSGGADSAVVIQGRLFTCPAGGALSLRTPLPPGSRSFAVAASWPILPAAPLPPLAPPLQSLALAEGGVCEPTCSPGFVCSHGTCVSACNPTCDQGQRCGEDRMCH
jgi:hypothetical protein